METIRSFITLFAELKTVDLLRDSEVADNNKLDKVMASSQLNNFEAGASLICSKRNFAETPTHYKYNVRAN